MMTSRLISYISIIVLFLSLSSPSRGEERDYSDIWTWGTPKYETRAVWLTTLNGLDWPKTTATTSYSVERQKKELTDILDKLQRANINTILFQVRMRGTVMYPSAIEPWDACLAGAVGRSPGYDPLQFAIDECHKRGMELHAWVVAIPVGRWNSEGCKRLRRLYPKMVKQVNQTGYLDPAYPGTADYLASLCAEITRNYDIDGIHLDYIRYSEKWPMGGGKDRRGRRIKGPTREEARKNLTEVVRRIHDSVKGTKPWVKISCAAVGKFRDLSRQSSKGWNAYNKVCQDAQGWLRLGYMDMLVPMMYFRGNQYYPFAVDWQEHDCGREIVSGLGIYFLSPGQLPRGQSWSLDDVTRQLWFLRQLGMGQAYFRSEFLTDNTKGLYDYVCDYIYPYPALTPPMDYVSTSIPNSPRQVDVRSFADHDLLTWQAEEGWLFNVYASDVYPVDIDDARNLYITKTQDMQVRISRGSQVRNLYYAVTAVDRYGKESQPSYAGTSPADPTDERPAASAFLSNDGKKLAVPDIRSIADADYLVIETLQGNMIASRTYNSGYIDISRLPEGVYQLRSVGEKKGSHRIGMFIIKREDGKDNTRH